MHIEEVTSNRLFDLVERILEHIVCVELVHLVEQLLETWMSWTGQYEEFNAYPKTTQATHVYVCVSLCTFMQTPARTTQLPSTLTCVCLEAA
jgi:hypothetical protein